MKTLIASSLIATLFAIPASAWTLRYDAESTQSDIGTVVGLKDGITYFQDFNNRRQYISGNARSGARSVQVLFAKPYVRDKSSLTVWASGFGLGTANPSDSVVEGDVVHAKAWLYLSPNWSWAENAVGGSHYKMMRVYNSRFYNGELVIKNDPEGNIELESQGFVGMPYSMHGKQPNSSYQTGIGAKYPIGEWFSIEVSEKISADPVKAVIRVWLNGKLVLEANGKTRSATQTGQTLNRNGSQVILGSAGVVFSSTWDVNTNTDGPAFPNGTQFMLIDDVVVTSDSSVLTGRDENGNPIIGDSIPSTPPPVVPTPTPTPPVVIPPTTPVVPIPTVPGTCTCTCTINPQTNIRAIEDFVPQNIPTEGATQ